MRAKDTSRTVSVRVPQHVPQPSPERRDGRVRAAHVVCRVCRCDDQEARRVGEHYHQVLVELARVGLTVGEPTLPFPPFEIRSSFVASMSDPANATAMLVLSNISTLQTFFPNLVCIVFDVCNTVPDGGHNQADGL